MAMDPKSVISIDSSSSDSGDFSDVEIIEPWDEFLRKTVAFKDACEVLSGKKYGSPLVEAKRKLLSDIVHANATDAEKPMPERVRKH